VQSDEQRALGALGELEQAVMEVLWQHSSLLTLFLLPLLYNWLESRSEQRNIFSTPKLCRRLSSDLQTFL
jgi:hypothetical protein